MSYKTGDIVQIRRNIPKEVLQRLSKHDIDLQTLFIVKYVTEEYVSVKRLDDPKREYGLAFELVENPFTVNLKIILK